MNETLPVPPALAGERVDRAVALLTGWSRAEVQALVRAGAVLVDGTPVAKSRRLETGDVIELLGEPEAAAGPPGPEAVPLDVRYDDDDVIVVAKPAGLVVHPGAGHAGGTLVNGLLAGTPSWSTSVTGPDRASCTASTATRAGCSSWPDRRSRTTRWLLRSNDASSNAATTRSSGDASTCPVA